MQNVRDFTKQIDLIIQHGRDMADAGGQISFMGQTIIRRYEGDGQYRYEFTGSMYPVSSTWDDIASTLKSIANGATYALIGTTYQVGIYINVKDYVIRMASEGNAIAKIGGLTFSCNRSGEFSIQKDGRTIAKSSHPITDMDELWTQALLHWEVWQCS